ncbi:S-layer homology domain-containing protein [Paenibacillus sp. RRE4]|uniref:S-layer homology domain-containing protein n=1 Tax=Paenibacillus sp. RRE4 TaxID=2962587 RepID=UPI00288236B2|nr:S-layer homology domain-containing protein [Paenibacillus sp. RRE4]MDT0125344.1 S-layer homology domain-containing protein [Paenibacillus sp. RRE4]
MKKVQRQGWKVSWRMLVWLLIISLVITAFPVLPEQSVAADLPMQQTTVTKSSEFQDVSPTDWFYDAIILVQEKGIFSGAVVKLWQAGMFTGDEKGNFNPGVQASRA